MKYPITLLMVAITFLNLFACGKQSSSDHQLKVIATAVPHAEILEQIKPDLAAKGIDLQIIVVDDYNIPNRSLADGEVDANFFQHLPFLNMQNEEFGYRLQSLGAVHIEPMGIYSSKIKSLKDLKPASIVAIPNDPSNEARALELLEKAGLIKLNRHDSNTTVHNIVENPLRLKFSEIDSPLLPRTMDDVVLAVITTNFALQAGLSPQKDALALEDKDSLYANIVAIRNGDGDRENLKALKEALQSEKIREYILKTYHGAIIPAF